jgi:hypothetical protein
MEDDVPEESTPHQPELAAASPSLPDIENLADSDDADVIEARAKLLEAQATLTKASTPLFDKIVIRGLIPIALAIVGPWALLKFDASQVEQKKQGEVILKQGEVLVKLEKLLSGAKAEAKARQTRSASWRIRMGKLEQERAAELQAMSTMVCRLDDTLKAALIQMAVARLLGRSKAPGREEVLRDVATQIKLPGHSGEREVRKIAGQTYDRLMKAKKK